MEHLGNSEKQEKTLRFTVVKSVIFYLAMTRSCDVHAVCDADT